MWKIWPFYVTMGVPVPDAEDEGGHAVARIRVGEGLDDLGQLVPVVLRGLVVDHL